MRFFLRLLLCGLLCFSTLSSAFAEGKKWALLIGVEEYENPDISSLRFAVKDVLAVSKSLSRLGYQVYTMTSAETGVGNLKRPTNINVLKALDRLSEDVREGDTFLLYFTGHGFSKDGQGFLGAVNTDSSSIEALSISSIPVATLQKKIGKLKAKQIIFIVDACRNDPEKGKGDSDNKRTTDFSKSLLVAAKTANSGLGGSAVLFACDEGERAFEDNEKGQSAFTYYLLEGLNGKAETSGGKLLIYDVADYVQREVRQWAKEHGKRQTPQLKTDGAAKIILADNVTNLAQAPAIQHY